MFSFLVLAEKPRKVFPADGKRPAEKGRQESGDGVGIWLEPGPDRRESVTGKGCPS